jgi:hypothetical protein
VVEPYKYSRRRNLFFVCESDTGEGCLLQNHAENGNESLSSPSQSKPADEVRLSLASIATSLIQGICLFAVGINSAKVLLGVTSVAASGGAAWIHSDPVRFTLRYVSAFLATATLWVIWNGWRLRNRGASRWRRVPLTARERWTIAFGLFSSFLSWVLILAEVFAHQKMHPR